MKKFFTIIFICFAGCRLLAQEKPDRPIIALKKTNHSITIDGKLDEKVWDNVETIKGFTLNFPNDSLPPTASTEVKMTFDDNFLYIGAICFNMGRDYIVSSLKRDYEFSTTESFNVYIDTYNDYSNGFTFGLSPYGIQREGLFSERDNVSSDWDNKWFVEVANYNDRWIAEIAIPFKTLRYSRDNKEWNINFLRFDLQNNERSTWVRVPQQFRPNNILYSGKLMWVDPPPAPGANISIIPYVSGRSSRDFENNESVDHDFDAGLDAKVGITPSLNLDLTFNPDFSQVEVDEQVTNLDRFELFFPEKRQFFLENSDLFAQSGFPSARPFFSRRIGIATDNDGNNVQTPILYGARLSGKLDQNWRIGLLNMQTKKDTDLGIMGQNYTVATVQRKIFAGSNLSGILVNRSALRFNESEVDGEETKYNRVWGLEYNFASGNSKWEGEIFYHRSESPGHDTKNFANGGFLGYNTRNLRVFWFHNLIGENYNAEVGFVPRTGFARGFLNINPKIYPKNPNIVSLEAEIGVGYTTNLNFDVLDKNLEGEFNIDFANTSEFFAGIERSSVLLTEDFDPTDTDGVSLKAGEEYSWTRYALGYGSDDRKIFNYGVFTTYGGFFNGNLFEFEIELNYRHQPYGNIGVQASYNNLSFPSPFTDTDFWLLGPKIDLTFTDKLFLTTFIQYNEQNENMNINARFQWRFKPVSDLFLVYTDNYVPGSFTVKNRALVLKISYWLNI